MDVLPPLWLPEILLRVLAYGADFCLSTSGGIDSQALLTMLSRWLRAQGFPGQMRAIWANLGRAEWLETEAFVEKTCADLEIPLVVVQRARGDLLDRFDERRVTLDAQGKSDEPHWPTASKPFCTSDTKRGPIDQRFRASLLLISAEGIRADESSHRAEKIPFTVRKSITGARYRDLPPGDAWERYCQDYQERAARPLQRPLFGEVQAAVQVLPRLAFTLYPMFRWTKQDAWHACGTSFEELQERRAQYRRGVDLQDAAMRERAFHGWVAHPAYVLGANRLSCSICFRSDIATIRAGAYHQPDYYRALCWRELRTGYHFHMDRWLCDAVPELLTDEQRAVLAALPQYCAWKKRRLRRLMVFNAT